MADNADVAELAGSATNAGGADGAASAESGRDPHAPDEGSRRRASWTFLTNHAHVLLAVARDHEVRVEEIAAEVGISSRATLSILADLEEAGYLIRARRGRRTHYELRPHQHFRHPASADHEVDELLAIFLPS